MHIDDYIQLIEASTQKELEDKLLIQDNFPILVNANFITLKNIFLPNYNLLFCDRYLPDPHNKDQSRPDADYIYRFNHSTGVRMQVIAWIPPTFPDYYPLIEYSSYNSTLLLHFDAKLINATSGLEYLKAGVEVIKDIYRMAKQDVIPFCLPSTFNLKATEGLIEFKP